jgi:hypothetical protein
MTGVVHVLPAGAPLPHNQDFYDREAADQRRDLLSDRDGRSVAACGQCGAQDSLIARVVTLAPEKSRRRREELRRWR